MSYSFTCSLNSSSYEDDYILDVNSQNDYSFRLKGHIQFPSLFLKYSLPSWMKKCVIDTNVKLTKVEKVQQFLASKISSNFMYTSFLTILDNLGWPSLVNHIWSKDLPSTGDDRNYLPDVIGGADLGIDVFTAVIALSDYIEDNIEEYANTSRMKRIEQKVDELQDYKNLNILLGNALNWNSSKTVIKPSGDYFDFSKQIDISSEQDGSFWMSEQVLIILHNNFLWGE